jgi:hypothetical protein
MPSKDEVNKLFHELKGILGMQNVSLEFLPFNQDTFKGDKIDVLIKDYERTCACAFVESKTVCVNVLKLSNEYTGLNANWRSVIAHELGHIKFGFQIPLKYSIDTHSNPQVDAGVTRYIHCGIHAAMDISSDNALPQGLIKYNYLDVSPLRQCDYYALKYPTTAGIIEISTEIPYWCAYKQVFPKQERERISSELRIVFNSLNHNLESLANSTDSILQPIVLGALSISSTDTFLALVKSLNQAYLQWILNSKLLL